MFISIFILAFALGYHLVVISSDPPLFDKTLVSFNSIAAANHSNMALSMIIWVYVWSSCCNAWINTTVSVSINTIKIILLSHSYKIDLKIEFK
jgi:hypothetical protein